MAPINKQAHLNIPNIQCGFGGGPSVCDEQYHSNSERIVALSTRWYNGGSRCEKMIRIKASNGKSVTAKVVGV
ncbi:hypothetical protein GOBAR_AA22341 [Gossypium barbadense]|uniref:Expansin-like EG45 domain-containing protein n=1 Tax=Gossypium barbadense TaxID=3634 RepID=A0A2P5X4R2_GOSBA|nr:hypothetical protein GOBAR_AA22341 [Gossypium barbadense]